MLLFIFLIVHYFILVFVNIQKYMQIYFLFKYFCKIILDDKINQNR